MEKELLKNRIQLSGYFNRAVLDLLRSGGEWSAAEITLRLMVSDPRGIIRELRNKGYRIPTPGKKAYTADVTSVTGLLNRMRWPGKNEHKNELQTS